MYLNCHSYHSLRYGTIPLNELVQLAATHAVYNPWLTSTPLLVFDLSK
jgi:DNA polymerase-3 subunit alpha/error-prone DNA polymerase